MTNTTDRQKSKAGFQQRISAEFECLDEVMSSGTLEERRGLIACYVNKIQAEPDCQIVKIGLYPTLFSQRIVDEQ